MAVDEVLYSPAFIDNNLLSTVGVIPEPYDVMLFLFSLGMTLKEKEWLKEGAS